MSRHEPLWTGFVGRGGVVATHNCKIDQSPLETAGPDHICCGKLQSGLGRC